MCIQIVDSIMKRISVKRSGGIGSYFLNQNSKRSALPIVLPSTLLQLNPVNKSSFRGRLCFSSFEINSYFK